MGRKQGRTRATAQEDGSQTPVGVILHRRASGHGTDPWADWSSPRAIALAVGLLVLATVTAYSNSFSGPFILDDGLAIVDNPTIRHLGSLGRTLSPPNQGQTVTGRPLLNLSLAINYAVSGTEVWSYHVANLAIHIVATLLLFGILRRTFVLPSMRDAWGGVATPLALVIALLWAVHPLQTESITYIVQRAESLVGLFYFLTLYCTIRAAELAEPGESESTVRRAKSIAWKAAAAMACCFGMASKEVMVSAPLIVFLYDRTFLAGSFREACRRRGGLYLVMASTWLLLGWLVASSNSRGGSAGFGTAMSSWTYLGTQFGAIVHYLRLCILPDPLVFDYGIHAASGAMEIVPYAIVVGVLGTATVAALWRWPKAGFFGAWFFAILAPTSSIVPVATQTMAEHRMYLPLAAVVTGIWTAGVLVGLRLIRQRTFSRQAVRIAAASVTVLVGVAFIAMTFHRNTDYQSELSIWQDTVMKRPNSSRAHNNLGLALAASGKWERAAAEYQKALDVAVEYEPIATFHNNFGTALVECGRVEEAIAQYQKALKAKPDYAQAYYNYGNILAKQSKFDEAIAQYHKALEYKPDYTDALNNLGNAILDSGHPGDAVGYYERALEFNPDRADTHCNLGAALTDCGRVEEAIEHCQRALAIKPQYAKAQSNLQAALVQQNQIHAALTRQRELVRSHPNDIQILNETASLLASNPNASVRNGEEALALAQRAVELSGREDPDILDTLAAAYAETGRFDEAVQNARKALEIAGQRNQSALADRIKIKLRCYEASKPFHASVSL